jgi:hypothetical protein
MPAAFALVHTLLAYGAAAAAAAAGLGQKQACNKVQLASRCRTPNRQGDNHTTMVADTSRCSSNDTAAMTQQ